MPITVTPTLEMMAGIYQLSSSGGAESDRFKAYVQAAPNNPIHGYNPMTSEPVVDTIQALIAIDAEAIAEEAANATAHRIGLDTAVALHLSVATPGMWTDRLATEVEHRLKLNDPSGTLLWQGSPATVEHIRQETIAQTVRLKNYTNRQNQPPSTLAEAVIQEGHALSLAGHTGAYNQDAANLLAEHANNESLAVMVAYLYGDETAATMGYSPISLANRTGYNHAIALHS